MLKLYKIGVTHYAPRDSHASIQEYVVAHNDKEVFDYINGEYAWWDTILDCCEDDYESYEEALSVYNGILKNKGDDREVYDLYYGATRYSWEEVELKDASVIDLMVANGIVKKIVE